jgi:hypothetical protein
MMTANPWINRAAVLFLLVALYALAYDYGKQEAARAQQNHPAAHLGLKP